MSTLVAIGLTILGGYVVAVPLLSWMHLLWLQRLHVRGSGPGEPRFKINVLVPCHGSDEHLAANLRAVADQDYPNYIVTYITDTDGDAAVPVIESVVRDFPHTRHFVAGFGDGRCSQLNHVQVAAMRADADSEIFAKCDADMRPRRCWLRDFMRPFLSPEVQVASSHHWVSPRRLTLGSCLYAALAGTLTMLMGSPGLSWVWGGCWAIRRRTYEQLGIAEIWSRTGTDDGTLQARLAQFGLRSRFVPAAVATTHEAIPTVREVLRWFSRQAFYGRVYSRAFWLVMLLVGSLAAAAVPAGVAALVGTLAGTGAASWLGWAGASALVAVMLGGLLVKLPYWKRRDMLPLWWALIPLLGHLLISVALWRSAFMTNVVWRGNTYAFNRDGSIHRFVKGRL